MKTISFQVLDNLSYHSLRGKFAALYLYDFTTGEYAQHISPVVTVLHLDGIKNDAACMMAFVDNRLIGFLITLPLEKDKVKNE